MEVRAWDEADLDWWIALRRQWQPSVGEAQLRALASGQVARFLHRTVAWDEHGRLGYAMIALPPEGQIPVTQVLVTPNARGKGVGSRLWADLLVHGGAVELAAWMSDDDPTSREVAEHWGFRVVSHAIRSRLDLPGVAEPCAPNPLTVRILEASDPPETKAGLERVLAESETNPEATELGWRHTVADFERMFPSMVWVLMEEQGVAVAVASTQRQDDEAWLVVYTGVVPGHRGRGLARLAKEHLHAVAASRGARALVTDNEARNTGILAVNSRLGYQRIGGELRLIRTTQ